MSAPIPFEIIYEQAAEHCRALTTLRVAVGTALLAGGSAAVAIWVEGKSKGKGPGIGVTLIALSFLFLACHQLWARMHHEVADVAVRWERGVQARFNKEFPGDTSDDERSQKDLPFLAMASRLNEADRFERYGVAVGVLVGMTLLLSSACENKVLPFAAAEVASGATPADPSGAPKRRDLSFMAAWLTQLSPSNQILFCGLSTAAVLCLASNLGTWVGHWVGEGLAVVVTLAWLGCCLWQSGFRHR